MRVLLVLKQQNYLATYDGVVRRLTERSHDVILSWPDPDLTLPPEFADNPRVSVRHWRHRRSDKWRTLATTVRRGSDYLRYLTPRFRGATKLRARAFNQLAHSLSQGKRQPASEFGDVGFVFTDEERLRLTSIAEAIEEAMPSDPDQEALLRDAQADVVLVSPLIDLGSAQTDIVKSARHLGIPSAMLMYSWDNLSTKGSLHVPPDRMFVWNERQRREAQELHAYPIERVVATGAPRFDAFLECAPVTDRVEFCEPLGFDPARPILMYLGSSKFVSEHELDFMRRWVAEIRTSTSEALRTANILIRPHPDIKVDPAEGPVEKIRWRDISRRASVTRPTTDPRVAVVRSKHPGALYDALFQAAAVIGLNTSAALEAAIVGRPVFTLLAGEEAADGQQTTLHFHYLLAEHGGCVTLAHDFDEHRAQLTDSLAGPDRSAQMREFAREFVRPAGWDRPAAHVLVDAIEREFG